MALTVTIVLSLSFTGSALRSGSQLQQRGRDNDNSRGGSRGRDNDNNRNRGGGSNYRGRNRGRNSNRRYPYGSGYPIYGNLPYTGYPIGSYGAICNQDAASFCSNVQNIMCPLIAYSNSCVCYSDGTCETVSGTNRCAACNSVNVVSVKDNFVCQSYC